MSDIVNPALRKHTPLHKDCPACTELRRIARANASMASSTLGQAGNLWLSQKTWKRRKPKTVECCRSYLRALMSFFGDMPLADFHPGSLLAYQEHRLKTCGPSAINHELNALSQILRQAGLWANIKDYYGPLPEPEWQKPKVLTQYEEERVFDFAKDDPGLELARLVFTITRFTSASGTELRLAQIRQLQLSAKPAVFEVTGNTTKNDIRPRKIPLLPEAEEAFNEALTRAARLGAYKPEHYLFPYRINRCTWDPNRPASKNWLVKQTQLLRERSGVKHLRPHGWRHQLCTEMLEQGARREDLLPIFGWVSEKMIETYEHYRIDAKMDTLNRFAKKDPGGTKVSNVVVFHKKK